MGNALKRLKYVILGAGPSGLSFAHALLDKGETSFLVLEQEKEAGGLCRSANVDSAPLDIGGGHFLDVKSPVALDFLLRFLPRKDWQDFDRVAKIRVKGHEIGHPFESHIWQLPIDIQIEYIEAVAKAGATIGSPRPERFVDWIRWKLGDKLADDFMIPYNQKLWSLDLSLLGTHWLHKLPDVSFKEVLSSCLNRRAFGSIPAHQKFLYPLKYGYGEVWKRMGQALGDKLLLNTPVTSLDVERRIVNEVYQADTIINTIPWPEFIGICHLPDVVSHAVENLRYVSIAVQYQPFDIDSDAHWIYEPDSDVPFHRILCRKNFALGSRGHWTEINTARLNGYNEYTFINKYAYPVPTISRNEDIFEILSWAASKSITGIGRWGKWEHMNSDVAVAEALGLASTMDQ